MHKFFVPENNMDGKIATITGDDVKHIYKVLRLKAGDKININNYKGKEFVAEIRSIDKAAVICNIIEEVNADNESSIKIHLYQALPKASKMELIIQKATELGVISIIPVITKRVVVKNEFGESKKIDRWNKIALEACKQSKRTLIPKVKNTIDFNEFLEEVKEFDLIVVPYENEKNHGIKNMISNIRDRYITNVAIMVGPEGGFEDEEIKRLEEVGAYIVTLGPRILRTETAGFVCSSLIMYELGDIGGEIQ
ncbi:ribosomal RNA small subunit methyltransferase E [Clostridium pasteurianum DSM 525 = ATCC 6013]|uniref:Ribosomal RNA small subunit methyltransferase E n=1 Tax=Clostridium pasteurianum DSM 525 = ATCC 6013 TaxID=1262449 RepID=A0A0H3J8S4_CLOPA|nr:16S rRNA (uracil(1498)-N(3))-methyltransferase [Clostridium pasteurianum]AJA48378.1 ribosomal RNA small subunit methyltransferase E [Clostridium pasteurianum DSM 525 = ATCC 6013]AJA52366.1 ribosomal RNA small subunit methyltransferase E [Clostridium pasteurianum DSM 525 = ATCC 6013]AOZ75624.1 16S rRNA methyltransferase [Clostridium pasteurianum DSM 525 = ATCC 6013]AOZ79420.1 16S rRNA methyltransferase [Clostridium pasteurianum]ELP60472.1 16S ribosomal RNA methyltransferase RsmE [Clostridium